MILVHVVVVRSIKVVTGNKKINSILKLKNLTELHQLIIRKMKKLIGAIIISSVIFTSCKKKECKRCAIEEYNQSTGQIQLTDVGEFCGKDLKKMEETTYTDNSDHSAKPHCK
jgi:hypothetical protein